MEACKQGGKVHWGHAVDKWVCHRVSGTFVSVYFVLRVEKHNLLLFLIFFLSYLRN